MSAQTAGIKDGDVYVFPTWLTVAIIMLIGAFVGLVISLVYSRAVGYKPKLWGISRIWLDIIAGAFWSIIGFCYAGKVLTDCDHSVRTEARFMEFLHKHPWTSFVGFLLVVDFIASIFLSLAVGLITAAILALVTIIIFGMYRLSRFCSRLIFGPEEDEEEL